MSKKRNIRWSRQVKIGGQDTTLAGVMNALDKTKLSYESIMTVLREKLGLEVTYDKVDAILRRVRAGKYKLTGDPSEIARALGVITEIAAAPSDEEVMDQLILKAIKDNPLSMIEIANTVGVSPKMVGERLDSLVGRDYNITKTTVGAMLDTKSVATPASLMKPPTTTHRPGHWFKFGILSDTHVGSMYEQITNRNAFIHAAYEYGIRELLMPGDWFAGYRVYAGQEAELYAHGSDAQLRVAEVSLPQLPGLRYHGIGGNHDYTFIKRGGGRNAVAGLARRRDDVFYYGYDAADITLIKGLVSARLWHPSGGVPYAVSYRVQKGLEQVAAEELIKAITYRESPTLRYLFAGHLHIEGSAALGPIKGYQVMCFEGKNGYLQAKGLTPVIGGLIIHAKFDDNGWMLRQKIEPVYYPEIETDYLNYPELISIALEREDRTDYDALFEWQEGEDTES